MNPTLSGSLPDFPPGIVLEELKLSATNLSGTLPESIGNLRLLKTLHLTACRFSGSLPASFHNLTRLVSVDLSINNFSGPVPSFASSPNISKIDLQNNSLSGPFPGWIFSLPSLHNELQGSLPMSISRLQHLKILRLASNNLSGTVELSLFGNLRNLSILDLSYNRLIVFPSLLRNLPRLTRLDLSGNNISGSIPDWLWSVGSLVYLNLSHNSLTNFQSLPDFSNSSLIVFDLHSNNLAGPIPRPPPSNVMVDFSNNHFAASIPSDIGSTLNFSIFFSVSNNRLTGGIPESVCSGVYLQLRSLNLHGNMLQGAVPQSLSSCEGLEVLDLGNNRIEDAFPSGWGISLICVSLV
ncbi:unnamed protein product [Spirodela intermedia]|uniref:Uncharacterized protein n=1 Tax=Spirodela intermedia TaxID=51605 RepID=A0A7I8IAL9_SPIIN|nr:unnamed protein product [Spirodela intermedia]CAA6654729.1 unnamed protein product [Spirodela intermedia]